jgi:hypothetical protein
MEETMKLNPARVGVILGLLLGIFHAGWPALVATNWAQKAADFVFWAHFITPVHHIEPFEMGRGAILLVLVFSTGAIMGGVAAWPWNTFASRQ